MKRALLPLLMMILLLSAYHPARAQEADSIYFEGPTTARTIMRSWDYHKQLQEESPFRQVQWRSVGPTRQGGRISSIDCAPGADSTIYISVGTAGVWKTENNGKTWNQLFTREATFATGDLTIAPSEADIIWVGSGEGSPPRSGYAGCGVYKSVDGGKSWNNMGLEDTQHIGRILIDPHNPQVVYVAALGHVYTRNSARGLYKTADGGNTWKKVLYIDNNTGVIDVAMDPEDSRTLYAAAWQQMRHAWDYQSCGPGSGIYKSTDGGESWREVTEGLPKGEGVGRIGLAAAASNPNVVYAAYLDVKADSGEPGVYRSDDKGRTWRKVSEGRMSSGIWYYFGDIRVSPDNEDQVYVLTVSLQRSDDGGKTFQSIGRGTHADHHALWIDPANPDRVLDGNDGGFYISNDRGETFEHINNMPIGEFYAISVDMAEPYNIYGGLQDNGCMMGSSAQELSFDQEDQWRRTGGGDGFISYVDPSDNSIIYTESQFGGFRRSGGQGRASAPREEGLRKNWMSPYIISPHNPSVLYFGANKLYKSINKGNDWICISGDLSKFRPERQGNVPHATLTTISESPVRAGLLYVGTDDGNVWRTPDDGQNWELINEGLPDLWVSRVIAGQYDVGTVYVTLTGYREDNFKPYVFKSTDFGKTWQSIESNLPIEAINVIREDPHKKHILYVGTELGVYASLDQGESWVSVCGNLPTTPVHDLVVHPRERDLIIGTHGRSIWILDDLESVQNFDVEDLVKTERPNLLDEPEEEIDIRPGRVLPERREVQRQRDKEEQQKRVIIVEAEKARKPRVREIREIYPPPGKALKEVIAVQEAAVAREKIDRKRIRAIREVYPHRPKTPPIEEVIPPDKPKVREVQRREKVKVQVIREIREIREIRDKDTAAQEEVIREIRETRKIRAVVIRVENPLPEEKPARKIRQIKEIRQPVRMAGAEPVAQPKTNRPLDLTSKNREIRENPAPRGKNDKSPRRIICESRKSTTKRQICETRDTDKGRDGPEIRENPGVKKRAPIPKRE